MKNHRYFMFLDTLYSSSLLFLVSSHSLFVLAKRSTNNFSEIRLEIIAATVGVLAINLRSSFNLLSPFIFYSSYSIDPLEIEKETKNETEARVVPIHEKVCRTVSMAGLIYAVSESHGNRKAGIVIVSFLSLAEMFQVLGTTSYPEQQRNKLFHFMWMFAGGLYGWVKKNDYCFYAYLPYAMSFLVLEPEKDRAWSTRRVVNNYMMIAHTILMLEAIREARDIPT